MGSSLNLSRTQVLAFNLSGTRVPSCSSRPLFTLVIRNFDIHIKIISLFFCCLVTVAVGTGQPVVATLHVRVDNGIRPNMAANGRLEGSSIVVRNCEGKPTLGSALHTP
ncbi:hypothetical protein BJ684DRAFT_22163 [Piptocephalis cylindrospora]|uniref:Uncharacterized protein n=1 Tax=Piptocephalis cylindrospora TaxID=1907219 RepID=A0A4P9XY02_9FUNG|nr:hypothetical protein BJ684DRAFT_22163 [Piptocephalis cylindrospora]|eukprot:RKP11286.1 hypothetical protein BJ684DRAFT_22163 [Piptocephalis cylindrospora]